MNYQPLFDLMSTHGLNLLEGEMDEIIHIVQNMQPTKPEPSRLEVAAMIYAHNVERGARCALDDADELIKQTKLPSCHTKH